MLFGEDGVAEGLSAGKLVIDMSSISPVATKDFAKRIEALGCDYLDAPVSGGEVGAKNAALTIMVGGKPEAFETAKPLFETMGKTITHVGPSGDGQTAKVANQIIVGLTIEAVAEALTFAKRAGADPAKVREALVGGFATSRILEVHGERMIKRTFDPGFRIRLHRKDMSLAVDAARALDLALPNAGDRRAADECRHRPRRRRPRPFRPDPTLEALAGDVSPAASPDLHPSTGRPAFRGPVPYCPRSCRCPASPSCRCRSAPSTSASPTRRREDWERDYGVAAEDGLNVFRHWFMWARDRARAGQVRLGRLRPPDGPRRRERHQDHHRRAHPRRPRLGDAQVRPRPPAPRATARRSPSIMGVSSATGGFANNGGGAGALTMNCPEVKEAAGAFLTALATRYRDHPGMLGYDVWNETNYAADVDYNPYTKAAFRDWLKAKYGDLDDARRGLAPLRPTPNGTTSSRRSQVGALPRMPRLARLQARQLLRPDAVAHRHHPRRRPEEPDRRARRRQRHPRHGRQRLRRLARRLQGRGLRLHLDPGAQGQPAVAQLLRRRHHPRRRARQAVLARRAPGRPALDAAAGARPRQGGRPRRRARGHPRLVADLLRRRRHAAC